MGIWIALAPWLLQGGTDVSRWADLLAGVLLVVLSIPPGRIDGQFGQWNRFLV